MDEKPHKQDSLRRLAYIEGHLRAVRKMVEEDRYCVDILKQTYAIKRALDKFEGVLLSDHLNHCVVEGIEERRKDQVIGELEELFELNQR